MPTVRFKQFRVYTGERNGQGLFVHARIFWNKREMLMALRAEAKAAGHTGFVNATEGAMQSFTHYPTKTSHADGCIGRVNLHRGWLGTEVISHEFAHAMFAWVARKRLTGTLHQMPVEEQACYVLGRMLRRFVKRAYAMGLYDADGKAEK